MENLTKDSDVVITSLAVSQATAMEVHDRKIVKVNIDPISMKILVSAINV